MLPGNKFEMNCVRSNSSFSHKGQVPAHSPLFIHILDDFSMPLASAIADTFHNFAFGFARQESWNKLSIWGVYIVFSFC